MLSINGLHNFYYLPELHDMRCKAQRICEIIRGRYHRDPMNGEARLYGMEESYRREKLTAEEIYRRSNSKETTEIIDKIRTELYDLLANPDESRSELMGKALNYLKNF